VADHDRVIADEHLLHDQAHDALAFKDIECVGGHAQPRRERRERLRQAQVCPTISGLFGDRVSLDAQRLLALAQWRHALPELLDRQEFVLIGGEQPLDPLAHAHQLPLYRLFPLFRRVGRALERVDVRERGYPHLRQRTRPCTTLGSIVRRRARTLFSCSNSCARAKVSSAMSAGTGISIHSSRGRS
jgi:hypothetical protein